MANDLNLNDQERFLLKSIQSEIDYHARQSKGLKNKAYFFKISTLILAGLVTIVLGIKMGDSPQWVVLSQNIALVLGALITILTGVASFWNIEKYWINNTIALLKLMRLRKDFKFAAKQENGISEDELMDLKDQFDQIIKAKLDYWENSSDSLE